MKKAKYYLALLAVVAIMTAGIGQAMAYFTTYAEAEGGITIWLGDDTTITETFSSWNKAITIKNEEGEPVFVRAKVFYAPSTLEIDWSSEDEGWSTDLPANTVVGADYAPDENNTVYYYYSKPLKAGEEAGVLNFGISKIPEDIVDGDSFNVIVVYESTPALYHSTTEDGVDLYYADWTSELVVTKRTGATTQPETPKPDEEKKPEIETPDPDVPTPDENTGNEGTDPVEGAEDGEGGSEQ